MPCALITAKCWECLILTRESHSMRSARPTWRESLRFAVPLALLWLLPVLAVTLVVPMLLDGDHRAVTTSLPATATVEAREIDHRQSVTATFTITEPQDILLSGGGLVTAVHAVPGQILDSSDAVVSVDGATLRAHVEAQPFYRDIGPGTRGSDLEHLCAYLALNGIDVQLGDESSYSASLARGLRIYQRANGLPGDGTFKPSSVIYIPPEATVVSSVLVTVGALVAPGDPVLSGPVRPLSLTLSADAPLRLAGMEGPFAVVVRDEGVPLTSLVPSLAEVVTLHEALVDAAEHGGPSMVTEGTSQSFTGVMLHRPSGSSRGTVPSTAVYTATSGTQCLFLVPDQDPTQGSPSPGTAVAMPIADAAPVDGEIGLASVQTDLIGRSAVRDPQLLSEVVLRTCG